MFLSSAATAAFKALGKSSCSRKMSLASETWSMNIVMSPKAAAMAILSKPCAVVSAATTYPCKRRRSMSGDIAFIA